MRGHAFARTQAFSQIDVSFTKAAKLRGDAKKWRVRFEFEGMDPYQDSRAMRQFKAKG